MLFRSPLGRKLFFYRSITPLPVVALALYFLTRARPPTGQTDALLDALGPLLGLGGAALRFAVTGAVPEGTSGQNDRLEAVVLNTRGPYAWVRNPLYVGNLGLVLGLLCVANDPWVWGIGLGFFFFEYAFIIRAEEAFLRTRFTHAFDDYCAKVPRWVPRTTAAFPGQPTVAQVGIFSRIALSVTHGGSTVSLPACPVSVTAAGTATTTPTTPPPPATGGAAAGTAVTTGSATLSWSKPTLNSDGTALTDLAGFVVEYGTDSAALSQRVSVADPNLTRYTVPNLGKGTWYFTVISYTATGLQSDVAKLVSKTIS